jgi:TPR repeat protein
LPALILIAPVVAQFRGWPPLPEEPMRLLMNGDAAGALSLVRTSAERGDAPSMFWLGRFLEEVERIPHDYREAMRWYSSAAERGVGVAAWSAGRLHEMGRGTPRDAVEAQRWYAKAAELGFRRTALTVIKARWFPGLQGLEYEPVPESLRQPPPAISGMAFLNPTAPDIIPDELEVLRKAGPAAA